MQAWKIIYKDLSILLRDRSALILLLGMPLALTGIMGFSTNQLLSNLHLEQIFLFVVDQDGGEAAQQFVQALSENEKFRVQKVDSLSEAIALVRNHAQAASVVVGPGFGTQIDSLELIDFLDMPNGRLGAGLKAYDIEIISREQILNFGRLVASQLILWKVLEVAYKRMLDRFKLIQVFIDSNPRTVPVEDSQRDSDWLAQASISHDRIYRFLVPSQAVLFTFFLVSIMARSFMAERVRGTFQRLRMAPISDSKLILGKTTPFFIISVTQGTLLFLSGWLLFGMPVGHRPEMLLLVIMSTSLAATTLGLLVAVTVRTDHQVTIVGTFLILGMAGISGCLMPRSWLPPLLKQVSLAVTPHAWALVAYDELLSSPVPDGTRVLLCCFLLVAFSFAFFGVSLWRLGSSTWSGSS